MDGITSGPIGPEAHGVPPGSALALWSPGFAGPLGAVGLALWCGQTAQDRPSTSSAGSPVEELRDLAREGRALDLRLAMLLACIWRMDLTDLGYTSRGAFLDECVDIRTTWARQLVRLIESPLDLVKRAVAQGVVPLRDAVRAPGHVEVEQQLAWILGLGQSEDEAASRDRVEVEEAEARSGDAIEGADASAVAEARRRARILMGHRANDETVDAFVVAVYERRVPLEELLAQARTRPEAPPEPGALSWDWCADEAPAQRSLGPWVEPGDLAEAMVQVRALKRRRDEGGAELARRWVEVDGERVWARQGYASRWAFAREVCGWSRRTAQRRARVGWALHWFPELDAAVRAGLGLGTAGVLAPVLGERNVERWLAVAGRTSRRELGDLVAAARAAEWADEVLERAEAAIAAVDAWQAQVSAGSSDGAPSTGDAPLRVSLARPGVPEAPEGRPPRGVWATDELVEAAWWWVEHVVLPPRRGFEKVKERDGYICQNPECRRMTFRVEAHHEQPRAHGGDDSDVNALCLCRPCHLRGIHTGTAERPPRITTAKVWVGDTLAILWTYAGGRQTLQLRGEPPDALPGGRVP